MKRFLTLSAILFSLPVFAQYTPQEIKKLKVTRLTILSATKGVDAIQKTETLYDENGNDTAEYNNGELHSRTKYEYNAKGQVISRTKYDASGQETESAGYEYKPDGSCVISNTDKSFGMTDLTYCDKTGKTTRIVSPDKTERIHIYDGKGKLIRIKSSTPDNGAVVTDIQYTYNPKGQMIREISKGDYKWTSVFTWDARGLITKVKRNSVTDGVADPEISYTYEYEFRK